MSALAAALLLGQALVAPELASREFAVSVAPDGRCRVTIEGTSFDPQREEDRLENYLAALPDKERPFHTDVSTEVPYRCLGGVIYLLQKHGVGRIGFVSEPPAPEHEE